MAIPAPGQMSESHASSTGPSPGYVSAEKRELRRWRRATRHPQRGCMADSAYIRDTYAYYARTGVPHDGIAEGVEHTRYKQDAPPWECVDPRTTPPPALHVDRYGFFDTPKQPSCIVLARHVYAHRRMLQRTRKARTPKSHVREPSADHVKTMHDDRASSYQRRESRRTRKWHGMLNESERCIEPGVSLSLIHI